MSLRVFKDYYTDIIIISGKGIDELHFKYTNEITLREKIVKLQDLTFKDMEFRRKEARGKIHL